MSDPPARNVTAGASKGRAALSKELSDFLIEFSIALHKHAMYPAGHPSLGPAAASVARRTRPLLADRGTLSLGVARLQLVIEGVATDPNNPVLRELAGRLHRHHLGAVTFRAGVAASEIQHMLSVLAVEADRTDEPLGLGPRERLAQWQHVQLYPVTYERLELVDDEAGRPPDEEEEHRQRRTRGAQLWIGLARAALAVDEDEEAPDTDPAIVAQAIAAHERGAAYDQVIVGYLLQMAEEVRSGSEAPELRQRMSQLVSTLDRDTLGRLLEMGGDSAQRRHFLLNANEGLAADAVLDLVKVAGEAEQQQISHSLLRMLQKLAQHAERGGARKVKAQSEIRGQVAELVRGWALKDPNPTGYATALEHMAATEHPYAVAPDQQYRPEGRRLVEMALELGAFGAPVRQAAERIIQDGDIKWLVHTLSAVPRATHVTQAIWDRLVHVDVIGVVAGVEPLDLDVLDALLQRASLDVVPTLLDVVSASSSSQTRRLLLDRLVRFGSSIGPLVLQRMRHEERWFVVRNLLHMLGELPELPAGLDPSDYAGHADARVRREALRILFRDPRSRERAIATALSDDDERNVRLGLTAALDGCPPSAMSLVVSRLAEGFGAETHTLAVRVLAATGQPQARRALLAIATPRKGLLRSKRPPKSPLYLAALAALRQFTDDPEARRILAAAARSNDPDVAAAALGTKRVDDARR